MITMTTISSENQKRLIGVFSVCAVLFGAMLFLPGQARAESSLQPGPAYREITVLRQAMASLIYYMDSRPDLFPLTAPPAQRLITRQRREAVISTYLSFYDLVLSCDLLGHHYTEKYRDAPITARKPVFPPAFAVFLAQYRYTLDFIERMERDPAMRIILNEPMPGLGLTAGSYSRLKFRFLNLLRGAEFVRLRIVFRSFGSYPDSVLCQGINEDSEFLWQDGHGKGAKLTAANALQILIDAGFTAWFPVQKDVAELMGHIKVWRLGHSLISPAQIATLPDILQPGDILLERREWHLSNIGLPGFWTHVALYVGTAEERRDFFRGRAALDWIRQQGYADIEELLSGSAPENYQRSLLPSDKGYKPRLIEALGEGVLLTSLEFSAAADSIAILRPRLDRAARARAVMKAFAYAGKPYDFNFDFRSDDALVCTELIYKAYESNTSFPGLQLPVVNIAGRPVLPANGFARLFDREYGQPEQQFDLILFLDGDEYQGRAVHADSAIFRKTWQRPKYHILLPETD